MTFNKHKRERLNYKSNNPNKEEENANISNYNYMLKYNKKKYSKNQYNDNNFFTYLNIINKNIHNIL